MNRAWTKHSKNEDDKTILKKYICKSKETTVWDLHRVIIKEAFAPFLLKVSKKLTVFIRVWVISRSKDPENEGGTQ